MLARMAMSLIVELGLANFIKLVHALAWRMVLGLTTERRIDLLKD